MPDLTLTPSMIHLAEQLNDFFADRTHLDEWMADLFDDLSLSLPIEVDRSENQWGAIIEASCKLSWAPVGTTDNEFIERCRRYGGYYIDEKIPRVLFQRLANLPVP